MSDWIKSWPTMDAYYDAQMSLCIRDCVLLESFRTEGSERELTEGMVMPAWQRAVERFGVKPLIVALEPVSGPLDLYWYSYPAEVLPVVEAALKGVPDGFVPPGCFPQVSGEDAGDGTRDACAPHGTRTLP
jgi:hypothetical protein